MDRIGLAVLGVVAACSFDPSSVGDDVGGDDATTPGVWRLDSDADFHAPGSWFTDAVTLAPGVVTVGRFHHGALRAAGRTGCGIGPGQQANIAWSEVTATAPVGTGYGIPYRPMPDGVPAGLGLVGDAFTAWWDGELYLEVGTHGFDVVADDRAFVEILGTDGWHRIAAQGSASGDVVIADTGWFPVRVAVADCGGAQGLSIVHRAPGEADGVPVSEARMRSIANGATGLVISGFDDRAILVPAGMTAGTRPLIAEDWGAGRPRDLGLTEDDTFTMRWTGQFRIDVAGDYTFRIRSDDGHRLRIDGKVELDHMSLGLEDRLTQVLALTAGWHDVVVDYQEDAGGASIDLVVASGPDLVGLPIPVDRLRPTPGTSGRINARSEQVDLPILDLQTTDVPLRIDALKTAIVDRVNFGYTIDHTFSGDLVITLISPAGTPVIVRDRVSGLRSPLVDRWIEEVAFAGEDPSGVWTLRVEDAAAVDEGAVVRFALTVHYAGGEPAQSQVATWISDVHPLGTVRSLDRLAWTATTPGTSRIAIELRTCPAVELCTGAFVPVPASGDVPAAEPDGFAQVRATLTAAGEELPSLDAIQLDYTP